MKTPKDYYPTYHLGCNPIHAVKDWAKVRKLIRDARSGADIPPILIDGPQHGGNMLTGTHRAAANDIIMMLGGQPLISVVTLDDIAASEELIAAVEESDYGRIDDLLDRKPARS